MAAPRHAFAADAEIALNPTLAGPEISPHIYGHFIEHLGGVIYDGIWVGANSKIPNIEGIRKQFALDMKQLGAPNLRWPGGCFADSYDWRHGVGPATKRLRDATYWGSKMPPELHGAEPNLFGTHEFMRLCRLTGASPYLAANVASGSPREFHDWMSYCNAPAGTITLAAERSANGDTEPFNVQYWGVGNESWGCGGLLKPSEYAMLYRLFTSQMPSYGHPFLIGCGPRGHSLDNGVSWTDGFLQGLQGTFGHPRLSGLSLHFYTDFRPSSFSSAESTPDEWYAVLQKGMQIEKSIQNNWLVMQKYDTARNVRLVIDEWGVWYSRSPQVAPGFQLAQIVTLRDAVHTAMHFDIFNRHAEKIAMANVAQTINCLHSLFLAHEDKFVRTPVFYVFNMYKQHMGARLVSSNIRIDRSASLPSDLPGLSSSASERQKQLSVTLTNPSLTDQLTVRLRINGSLPLEARADVLTHQAMNAANTFDKPNEVRTRPLDANVSQSSVTVTMPQKSVAAVQIRLT